MKNAVYLFISSLICCLSCTPNTESAVSEDEVQVVEVTISDEEKAINQVVKDAYAVISFEVGTTPDYEAIKAIFTPDAVLHNFRNDSLESYMISDFVEVLKMTIDEGQMMAFDEVELGGETEYFGKIGHRISSYASYFDGAEEIGERGVNSFQVLKIDGEWKISSIIWDVEREGQQIPEMYISAE